MNETLKLQIKACEFLSGRGGDNTVVGGFVACCYSDLVEVERALSGGDIGPACNALTEAYMLEHASEAGHHGLRWLMQTAFELLVLDFREQFHRAITSQLAFV